MVLQNYQNFIELTSNMIYIVAFGGGLKCPRKIHLNTQWGEGALCIEMSSMWTFLGNENGTAHVNFEVLLIRL